MIEWEILATIILVKVKILLHSIEDFIILLAIIEQVIEDVKWAFLIPFILGRQQAAIWLKLLNQEI